MALIRPGGRASGLLPPVGTPLLIPRGLGDWTSCSPCLPNSAQEGFPPQKLWALGLTPTSLLSERLFRAVSGLWWMLLQSPQAPLHNPAG